MWPSVLALTSKWDGCPNLAIVPATKRMCLYSAAAWVQIHFVANYTYDDRRSIVLAVYDD